LIYAFLMQTPPAPNGLVQLAHDWNDLKLTYAFLFIFACVFGLELYLSHSLTTPAMAQLVLMGGSNSDLVLRDAEWYRLFTAGLLHGGWMHLLFNSYAFYFAGTTLEPLLGRAWLFVLFWVGVVGGSVAGLYLNAPNIISVGASGGIMGLLAAMFVVAHRFPPGDERNLIRTNALQVLIPSLIPIGISIGGAKVDYGAHAGGAAAGALAGVLILALWPRARLRPYLQKATLVLAVGVALAVGYCVAQVTSALPKALKEWEMAKFLVPAPVMHAEIRKPKPDLPHLIAQFPRDPAPHYYMGKLLLFGRQTRETRQKAAAEFELALAQREMLDLFYWNTELELRTREALAEVWEKDSPDKIAPLLKRYCGTPAQGHLQPHLRSQACP
jgi:rhomboid protease GluP